MTTATLTLTDFLLARIAEDEAAARSAPPMPLRRGIEPIRALVGEHDDPGSHDGPVVGMAIDPARVLAECEAKRRIVERHAPTEFADAPGEFACVVTPNSGFWPCADLLDIAAIYSEHAEFREEWRV